MEDKLDICWLRCNKPGGLYRPFRIEGDPWQVYSCALHATSSFKHQWADLKKRLQAHYERVAT